MKILFLDIDGVLNNKKTPMRETSMWPLSPWLVKVLHRILCHTGSKVVLSSSWRHDPEGINNVRLAVLPHELIGITSRYSSSSKYGVKEDELCRGHNIQDWFDENKEYVIDKYAILDDSGPEEFLDHQHPNFFKTETDTGLTEEIADRIIIHLE